MQSFSKPSIRWDPGIQVEKMGYDWYVNGLIWESIVTYYIYINIFFQYHTINIFYIIYIIYYISYYIYIYCIVTTFKYVEGRRDRDAPEVV